MNGDDFFGMVLLLIIAVGIGIVGFLVIDTIQIATHDNVCIAHGFDGGGKDRVVVPDDKAYDKICFRGYGPNAEVFDLDWVKDNCTGNGVCYFDGEELKKGEQ